MKPKDKVTLDNNALEIVRIVPVTEFHLQGVCL